MRLRFTDGVTFDTSGPVRVERRWDGWYVVGGGMLSPHDSEESAREYVARIKDREKVTGGRDDG